LLVSTQQYDAAKGQKPNLYALPFSAQQNYPQSLLPAAISTDFSNALILGSNDSFVALSAQQPQIGQTIYLNNKRPDGLQLVMADTAIQRDSVQVIISETAPNIIKIDTVIMNETVYEDAAKNIETMYPVYENTLSYFDTLEEKKSELSFFHTVQAGETLYGIAKKYNVKVDALQFLNALKNNNIEIGQKLIINPNLPSADTKEPQPIPGFHIVRHGETLYSISILYNISVNDLKAINTLTNNEIKIDQRLMVVPVKNSLEGETKTPTNVVLYYTIENGETLFSISRKFNVSISSLKQINTTNLLTYVCEG
jgi:LysM repeat protein